MIDEQERDIRDQCEWDEALSERLDREDFENDAGDYAPKEDGDE
jgi:hypothetical protein